MSYLIIPDSATGLIKPNAPLQIDYASGLAAGLRNFFVCDGGGMTDLVTGKRYPATGGSRVVGSRGIAWASGGSGTRIHGPSEAEAQAVGDYRGGSGVTVFFAGNFTTSGSPSACPISCTVPSSVGGWAIKTEQWPDIAQVGYSSRGVTDQTSGISTPIGSSVISVRMAATGTNYYRVNDLAIATSTNSAPAGPGTAITLGAARAYGGYEDVLYSGNYIYWAAIYNRDVGEGVRNVLHTRPFGTLVTKSVNRVYFIPATATASAAITGTATASITEADIITGGKTIIITLTGDTFLAAGTGPIGTTANTQALIDGIDSAQAEGTGWDSVVKVGIETADVVRTSDTVATITLDAEASYNITATETITATIPAAVLTGGVAIVGSPTFTITATGVSAPIAMYHYMQMMRL